MVLVADFVSLLIHYNLFLGYLANIPLQIWQIAKSSPCKFGICANTIENLAYLWVVPLPQVSVSSVFCVCTCGKGTNANKVAFSGTEFNTNITSVLIISLGIYMQITLFSFMFSLMGSKNVHSSWVWRYLIYSCLFNIYLGLGRRNN